jgi:bifunctional UDP-N-acetylglucosamine pyrophosphorylase/glucosamine-1-phosphate N-acetyltransferase
MIKIAGVPALEHVIRRIKRAGVDDFILVVKYKAESIMKHFGNGYSLGIRIDYAQQPDHYGTAAALLAAEEMVGTSSLMMTYGDIIADRENYTEVVQAFEDSERSGVVTIDLTPDAGSSVTFDNAGRILGMVEKPPKGKALWNSSGIFAFKPDIFGYLKKLSPSARGEYELADAMTAMIADGNALEVHYLKGKLSDIGTIEGISAANIKLAAESD